MKKSLIGKKFGKWEVIESAEKRKNNVRIFWKCKCECGNTGIVDSYSLKSGHSKSCGCLRKNHPKILPNGIPEQKYLFRIYKRNAEARNLDFFLTNEQFVNLVRQNCFYCGIKPEKLVIAKGYDGKYSYNGVDRVDSTLGYIISNCVPCCETCNRAKRAMSVEEFYSWIDRVYHHIHPNRLSSDVFYDWHMMPWSKFADTKIGE